MPLLLSDQAHFVTAEDDYYFGCELSDRKVLSTISLLREDDLIKALDLTREMPVRFSLRDQMSRVEYQGQRGTCVAFCINAVLEYKHRKDLSEQFTYWLAESNDDNETEGLPLAWAAEFIRQHGTVAEELWPYSPAKNPDGVPPQQGPPPDAAVNGSRFRFDNTFRIDLTNVNDTKSVINGRNLVMVAAPCFLNVGWFPGEPEYDRGNLRMPAQAAMTEFSMRAEYLSLRAGDFYAFDSANDEGKKKNGWHAVPLVGYDDTVARFEFKNSWGGWGDVGYGTMPYEYVRSFCRDGIVGT